MSVWSSFIRARFIVYWVIAVRLRYLLGLRIMWVLMETSTFNKRAAIFLVWLTLEESVCKTTIGLVMRVGLFRHIQANPRDECPQVRGCVLSDRVLLVIDLGETMVHNLECLGWLHLERWSFNEHRWISIHAYIVYETERLGIIFRQRHELIAYWTP